jgi:hypothetical protein
MRDVQKVCFLTAPVFVGLTSIAFATQSDPPMFLCPTPTVAKGFWKDLIGIVDRRVQMSQSMASQLAIQHRCWVETNESRPVAMHAGAMRIGNGGSNDGYVTPDYYVYVQFLTYAPRP